MTKLHRLRWGYKGSDEHRKFIAQKLISLKNALNAEIVTQTNENSLRLATWNIMHFGNGGAYVRSEESMLYIAEIIDHFDLVAVQEVNRNLRAFKKLMEDHLGAEWDYVITDTTEGDLGNNERLAFVFRKAKVRFTREVGEIVLPKGQRIAGPEERKTVDRVADPDVATGDSEEAEAADITRHVQFARTPFSVSFQCDWLKFKICTVHIYFGSKKRNPEFMDQRRQEIDAIAEFLKQRHDDEQAEAIRNAKDDGWVKPEEAGWGVNYLLIGDFNIVSPEHETMEALERDGRFTVATKPHRTNLGGDKYYDQIAYRAGDPRFEIEKTGVFSMFDHIYRDDEAARYAALEELKDEVVVRKRPKAGQPKERTPEEAAEYFKRYYRKHQISDHKLLWAELRVDYSGTYLQDMVNE